MQQVNLYQPILRKQEKVFSAKTLLQGNLIVLLGLLLLFGYTALQTGKMSEQVEQVQRQRDEQTAQLADLARQFPPKEKDAALPGRIDKAQAKLQYQRRLLAAVGNMGLGDDSGFSHHLSALARQDLPQLWLDHIYLQQGNQVTLHGGSSQADEVAHYLQRLQTEQAFSGTAFLQVEISRSESRSGVDFTLTTQQAEEEQP